MKKAEFKKQKINENIEADIKANIKPLAEIKTKKGVQKTEGENKDARNNTQVKGENQKNEPTNQEKTPSITPNKGKRGRHKKECTCEKCQAKKDAKAKGLENSKGVETRVNSIDNELDNLRNEQLKLSEKDNSKKVITDNDTVVSNPEIVQFINGYILLIICDVFFPMILSKVFKKQMKENKKSRRDLKLTKEEKEELQPLADACAKEMSLNMSPTKTFAFAMFFVYGAKIDE